MSAPTDSPAGSPDIAAGGDALPPKPSAQWANSYEAQLTSEELRSLYRDIAARLPYRQIVAALPPWRHGPQAGKRPHISMLTGIARRMQRANDLAHANALAQAAAERFRNEHPEATEEEMDAEGQRTFTSLARAQGDLKAFVLLRGARNAHLRELRKIELKEREVALAEQRYRRETCELFLKWSADRRASEIAAGAGSNAEKIDQLGRLMFADWDKATS